MSKPADRRAPGKLLALRRVSGHLDDLTDESLVAASATGDDAAVGALYDRHSRAVYRFVSRLMGVAEADLDDVVSATFIEASRSFARFRGGSSVLTWLMGIAVNVVRHHVRGAWRRRVLLDQYRWLPRPQSAPGPDVFTEQRELIERQQGVLDALPHDLKVAFVMCDVEEIPCSKVAVALGVREGTVWKRLYRARRVLGSALE